MLIGDRELAIMKVLSQGDAIDELAPDKKLQAPAQSGLVEDIIL
jgi:hypothetical protein